MSVTLCSLSNDAARSFTNEKVAIDVPRPACPRREAFSFVSLLQGLSAGPTPVAGLLFSAPRMLLFCRAVTHRSGSWENVWQPSPCPRGPLAQTTSTPKLTVYWELRAGRTNQRPCYRPSIPRALGAWVWAEASSHDEETGV